MVNIVRGWHVILAQRKSKNKQFKLILMYADEDVEKVISISHRFYIIEYQFKRQLINSQLSFFN